MMTEWEKAAVDGLKDGIRKLAEENLNLKAELREKDEHIARLTSDLRDAEFTDEFGLNPGRE